MAKEPNLPPRENIPADLHPVVTHTYNLPTPAIELLLSVMVDWIRSGVTGATIEGTTRAGKTRARRLVARALPTAIPRLPVIWMLAHRCEMTSERAFYGELLRAVKHQMWSEGTAAQRRDRLIESIVGLVQTSGQGKLVLLIDEAEYLLESHFHWLVGVFNELDERGIELYTFFFGQRELSRIRDDLRRAKLGHILSRFLDDRHEFFGIRSVSELKSCLACYDTKLRFPEDTDWTFTRYYFTDAFGKGWRLAGHAQAFWSAFEEVYRHGAPTGPMEIPTKHFVRSVEKFLLNATLSATGEPVVSHSQLVDFIASTGFGALPRDQSDEDDDPEDGDERS